MLMNCMPIALARLVHLPDIQHVDFMTLTFDLLTAQVRVTNFLCHFLFSLITPDDKLTHR